jgi:hypothetical protein
MILELDAMEKIILMYFSIIYIIHLTRGYCNKN